MVDEYLPPPSRAGYPTGRTTEPGDWINMLDKGRPVGSDRIGKGDDHIRLIKGATKATFENFVDVNYVAYKQPVLYSTSVLNFLKLKINGVADKTYYIPQKTIYDANPTGASWKTYNFYIEDIAVDGQRRILTEQTLPPLGQIFASILTEQKINEHHGLIYTNGVPNGPLIFKICDGTSVSNSKYALTSGKTNTPDLVTNGLFLARLTDESLGYVVDKSYPKDISYKYTFNRNILNPFIQAVPEHNHSATGYNNTTGINPQLLTGQHSLRTWSGNKCSPTNISYGGGINWGYNSQHTSEGEHTHTSQFDAYPTASANTTKETAPDSILVNYMMRIN